MGDGPSAVFNPHPVVLSPEVDEIRAIVDDFIEIDVLLRLLEFVAYSRRLRTIWFARSSCLRALTSPSEILATGVR